VDGVDALSRQAFILRHNRRGVQRPQADCNGACSGLLHVYDMATINAAMLGATLSGLSSPPP
jgi:hypothetical protein